MGDKTIYISGDHAATVLLEHIEQFLIQKGHKVKWLKPPQDEHGRIDYPNAANLVCEKITTGKGILVCGSGQGIAMAANRHKHIRAALCHEPYSAELARGHNDANVLCLGARLIGNAMAEKVIETFTKTNFDGGRHQHRLDLL